jgi:hypothetical protein
MEVFPEKFDPDYVPPVDFRQRKRKLPKVALTEEQKLAVLKKWNEANPQKPPTVLEMVKAAFPEDDFDGRSVQGKAVLDFLASKQLKALTAADVLPPPPIILTKEQKEYIYNNCEILGTIELSREIFKNPELQSLHRETRAVYEYLKTITGKQLQEESTELGEYRPPKNIPKAVTRINRFLKTLNLVEEKLTSRDKKNLTALIAYLHTLRFMYQINRYEKQEHKELFESSFIRYTWDKGDLTEEEVDQYIMVASEVVNEARINDHINELQILLDEIAQQTNEDNKKFSMGLIEAMTQARKERKECSEQQRKWLQVLIGKRSERLANQKAETASILNLVALWKEEESRTKLIELSEKRRSLVKEEINRLSSLDDVQAMILGISEEDVLDG